MRTSPSPTERLARLTVDVVRGLARRRVAMAILGLTVALVASIAYIAIGALGVNPLQSRIAVRVLLAESGGLMPNQDVTLRGVPIGRVKSVNFTPAGVVADAEIDGGVRVPQNSDVKVSGLSPAGEQYLEFRPQGVGGPALADGALITEDRTSTPVSLAQLLATSDGVLAQLDPEKLRVITDELRVTGQGPQKLAALFDGGVFLLSTIDGVLPETMSVLRSSGKVLSLVGDVTPGLGHTSRNLRRILDGVNAMDGGFRTLMDRGAAPMTAADGIIDDNSATMVQLLGNLTTVAQVTGMRVPALHELVAANRGSALTAVADFVHDGYALAIVDIYPRYACDYDLPRLPAFLPTYAEPYLYTYCNNPDPGVLVRGARNAPRPPGDDTAGPPPDYDRLAQSDPTPPVKSHFPTPFGGGPYPVNLPADPPEWQPQPNWPLQPPIDYKPPPPPTTPTN
ncbi:MlaD family protein [Mycolicibacterium sp. 050232]|nr:MlaD family protein [Mycolicibacterium sp. 050232]MED5810827.1 MlaD family protein [Mycolicibacterium sp. 050232]